MDAAIGGKTGVNLIAGKNLIGSFHQPLAVLIDPAVLDTLPEREYRAGLFEIIKHGVIADAGSVLADAPRTAAACCRRSRDVVDRMICDSVRIKAEVVSGDEKEEDRRRILNFGHTFGHALEAETGLLAISARRSGGVGHEGRQRCWARRERMLAARGPAGNRRSA